MFVGGFVPKAEAQVTMTPTPTAEVVSTPSVVPTENASPSATPTITPIAHPTPTIAMGPQADFVYVCGTRLCLNGNTFVIHGATAMVNMQAHRKK